MQENQNQNPIQQELGKDHKHAEHFWLAIAVLVLIAIAVSGLVVYKQNFQQSGTSTPLSEKNISPEDVEGWQTYRNEEFGFEFRYPPELQIKEKIDSVSLYDSKTGTSPALIVISIFDFQLDQTKNRKQNLELASKQYLQAEHGDVIGELEEGILVSASSLPGKHFFTYNDEFSDKVIEITFASPTFWSEKESIVYKSFSTFKFIDNVHERITLVPPYNIGDITAESCKEDFDFSEPNQIVPYSSEEWGFSFDVPYNEKWGNEKYKLNPYDERVDWAGGKDYRTGSEIYAAIVYGPIGVFEACGWIRNFRVEIVEKKTADEILESLSRADDYEFLKEIYQPEKSSVNNLEIVKYRDYGLCSYSITIVIGKKYNYIFEPLCNGGFLDEEVNSVKLIE